MKLKKKDKINIELIEFIKDLEFHTGNTQYSSKFNYLCLLGDIKSHTNQLKKLIKENKK